MVTETFERKFARLEKRVDVLEKAISEVVDVVSDLLKYDTEFLESFKERDLFLLSVADSVAETEKTPEDESNDISDISSTSTQNDEKSSELEESVGSKEANAPQAISENNPDMESQTAAHRQPVL